MGFRQWEAVTPEMFQKFHNKFPEKIENLKKKLCGKKALTSPFPKEIENLKIPKINFTSTFGKKLEVEKTNFPNKIQKFKILLKKQKFWSAIMASKWT